MLINRQNETPCSLHTVVPACVAILLCDPRMRATQEAQNREAGKSRVFDDILESVNQLGCASPWSSCN